jgi:hypothetical protein
MEYIRSNKCYGCGSCKSKYENVIEDVTRMPSMHILVEANQEHRETSQNDLEMKVNVWGAASPPTAGEESKYSIDLIALEKANALRNGTIVLRKAFNNEPIKSFGEDDEEDEFVDGGEDAFTNDDDDDEASSSQ